VTFATALARADTAIFRHVSTHQAVLDGARALAGIFDNGHREALGAIGVQDPSFTAPSTAVATAVQGSALRIDGVGRFTVRDVQPDGTGVTVLTLTKAD
jgi:hypothetical protein